MTVLAALVLSWDRIESRITFVRRALRNRPAIILVMFYASRRLIHAILQGRSTFLVTL